MGLTSGDDGVVRVFLKHQKAGRVSSRPAFWPSVTFGFNTNLSVAGKALVDVVFVQRVAKQGRPQSVSPERIAAAVL